MTVESRYVHPEHDTEPRYRPDVVSRLSPPDDYESGPGHPASRSWRRLVQVCRFLTDTEVRVANFMRELYRGCETMSGKAMQGGSGVFEGANIRVLGDRKKLYLEILSTCNLTCHTRKKSSHENDPDVLQLEIPLHSGGVVLVGFGGWKQAGYLSKCSYHTWLQCERAPYASPFHLMTYAAHKISHQQFGPFGHSGYSEKLPDALCICWSKAQKALPLLQAATVSADRHP